MSELRPDLPATSLAIDDYDRRPALVLTDEDRWPGLAESARARLDSVRAASNAPAWTHEAGHRLDAAGIDSAQERLPVENWLDSHLAIARELPAYRGYQGPLEQLADFPPISREDLVRDIGGFVPLHADLSRMTQGTSSGSTGRALLIPEDPEEIARTFWMLVELVTACGVDWRPDSRRLAIANVVNQSRAYTYASAVPGFGESVMARLNLHPDSWAGRARADFLSAFDPQVISGAPSGLVSLLDDDLLDDDLRAVLHPLAIVSGATHLTPALREALTARFGCPILDLYGLHETRPIGLSVDGGPFVILDRRVVVELLGPSGDEVRAGERGEIVVTTGENRFLPLVRYRTGDFGRLVSVDGRTAIADLEGREEVMFTAADGTTIPAVDLTQQLQAAGAHGWSVHQDGDGQVSATVALGDHGRITARLRYLFGPQTAVRFVDALAELGEGKPRRYSHVT
jgi:phenylacetate-CoA ligase